MMRYIVVNNRRNSRRRREIFERFDGPKVFVPTPTTLQAFYEREGLMRPRSSKQGGNLSA